MTKTLILGGTQFIGRTLVERLQDSGEYELTLFNRQLTGSNLFPEVKRIKGDRETSDIEQISNQEWDYVIDISCYYPASLLSVLDQLKKPLKKYILISTCSVYDTNNNPGQLRNESAIILGCTNDQKTDRTTTTYGNRKAECERILAASDQHYTILRPALVYGRYDHTDRFYYWLYQVKANNPLLIPDNGERLFSITYVEDLVKTIIHAMQDNRLEGVYNTITVPQASIRQIIDATQRQLSIGNEEINASPEFLKQNEIDQWSDMPLWIDNDHFTFSKQKLIKECGNSPSEFETTIKETLDYYSDLGWKDPRYGMSEKTRQGLIEKIEKG